MEFFGFTRAVGTSSSNVFVELASTLLCHTRFPSGEKCSPYWFLWTSLHCSDRNSRGCLRCIHWYELFSSVPTHQSFEMHRLFHGQFCCAHSIASDFSSTAQHIVCPNESSVQGSAQSVSNIISKLPSSSIKNALTVGSLIESSISCSVWTKVQWKCVHCSSRVQVPCHSLKPLGTARGTKIKTSQCV